MLWTALLLVAVINTIIFGISNLVLPAPATLPAFLNSPLLFFCIGLVLRVKAMLDAIAKGHPAARIDEPLPWNFDKLA